jgi:hypothetical protein
MDLVAVETRLNAERATGTTLTSETVADPNAPRFSLNRRPELTAAARRLSTRHRHTLARDPRARHSTNLRDK